jgi:hypothetical protein
VIDYDNLMDENQLQVPEPVPLRADGTPKVRFDVGMRRRPDGTIEKAVFIDGKKLDWSLDMSSLMEAKQMGPKFFREMQKDIIRHYTESVSDFMGRRFTIEEIQSAIQSGWL